MSYDLTPVTIFIVAAIWLIGAICVWHLLKKKPGKFEWLFSALIGLVLICATCDILMPAFYGGTSHIHNHYSHAYIEANSP